VREDPDGMKRGVSGQTLFPGHCARRSCKKYIDFLLPSYKFAALIFFQRSIDNGLVLFKDIENHGVKYPIFLPFCFRE